ncbi:uncharacterized protein METZ01_LOCUS154350 [marine metagenome]|uniref:Uncharacterized protein n=1 Tax=marine metagenome TaxID=408172 RepID=A0A382AJ20_9ZZZZ
MLFDIFLTNTKGGVAVSIKKTATPGS